MSNKSCSSSLRFRFPRRMQMLQWWLHTHTHTAQKRLAVLLKILKTPSSQKGTLLSKGFNWAQLSHALLPSAGWRCAGPPESLFTRIPRLNKPLTWSDVRRLKSFDTPTEGCLPSNIPGFKSQGPKAELLCCQSSSAKRKELLQCVAKNHQQGRHSLVTTSQH